MQVFLKGEGGAGTFPTQFFQGLTFLYLEITICKIKENFFSATIILEKKAILSCLKRNLKVSHKWR